MICLYFKGTTNPSNPTICSTNLCLNGGTCLSVPGGGFRCICRAGFTGARCDLPNGNYVQINTIYDKLSILGSATPTPFTTTTCPANLCLNGGTCQSVPGSGYRCVCRVGFTGARCDIPTGILFIVSTVKRK